MANRYQFQWRNDVFRTMRVRVGALFILFRVAVMNDPDEGLSRIYIVVAREKSFVSPHAE